MNQALFSVETFTGPYATSYIGRLTLDLAETRAAAHRGGVAVIYADGKVVSVWLNGAVTNERP